MNAETGRWEGEASHPSVEQGGGIAGAAIVERCWLDSVAAPSRCAVILVLSLRPLSGGAKPPGPGSLDGRSNQPKSTSASYRFDVWTTDNGLPQNSINSILQTSDGFIWMTTFDGLVRYDGVRFKVFNGGNTGGLKSSRFLMLFEDRDKHLWITTEEHGITLYKDGVFKTYTTEDGLPHDRISRSLKLREDLRGLVINTDGGAVRWKGGKLFPYVPNDGDPYAAKGFPARPGVVWWVDQAGLHRVENSQVTMSVACAG